MTREEAIKIIDCYDIGFYDLSGEKIPADKLAEALDMAIEALSETSGDLISRQDAISSVEAELRCTNKGEDVSGLTLALSLIDALPSALADIGDYADRLWKIAYERGKAEAEAVSEEEHVKALNDLAVAWKNKSAERPKGEWIRKYDKKINCYWYECDQCGEYRPRNQFGHEYNANFCPNCGADMRGDTE